MRPLLYEGENRAVRCFLALYGGNCGITISDMCKHMESSGYPLWPNWVDTTVDSSHLTKLDAQMWLRHLFSLEDEVYTQKDLGEADNRGKELTSKLRIE